MKKAKEYFTIEVEKTRSKCPIGEKIGKENIKHGKIPVLSCEGACIRGEIARIAANHVAKDAQYGRGCHGELFAVPDSFISKWIINSEKIVLIDGCFLKCHERILKGIIDDSKIYHFDALSYYKKYTDKFGIEEVPLKEREDVGINVANWVLASMKENLNK
jgi:hypothetical protein